MKELADSKPSINENTKQEIDKKYKNYETALKYNSWKELVFDNITTALKMNLNSSIQVGWGSTNNTSSLRPNTIEFFIKPDYNDNFTIVSGSGWNIELKKSTTDSKYGNVLFNYSGSNLVIAKGGFVFLFYYFN